jgi:hypothetical protein
MEKVKEEIMNILIANQETCKIGSDGDYSTELCVFAYDFDLVASHIASFIQAITDPENQPNQFGIILNQHEPRNTPTNSEKK